MTVGELRKRLADWPDETEVMIDVAQVSHLVATDYQWHDFEAVGPSEGELVGGNTFTTLVAKQEIVGY